MSVPHPSAGPGSPPFRYRVLSVKIDAVSLDDAARRVLGWVVSRARQYVSVCTSDLVMRCHDDPELARIVKGAGLATPDGMPLVWMGRAKGLPVSRVYGPDLMADLCHRGIASGVRHFFYGSTQPVLDTLARRLTDRCPGLILAGSLAPPFRPLTEQEVRETVDLINAANPDIVWIGLGTPKQDYWISRFRPLLDAPVLIPVGAAFGFLSGHVPQAPRWMMAAGLEWLFRLITEPRRLWRRYLLGNPRFVYHVVRQYLGASRPGRERAATAAHAQPFYRSSAGAAEDIPRVNVLGVGVNALNMDRAVSRIVEAAVRRQGGYVCVTSVHGVIESQSDRNIRRIHNRSLLTVPDGMPTVWTGRRHGFQKMSRVYGPDLMLNVCRAGAAPGMPKPLRHYLCGATRDTLDSLELSLRTQIPGLCIVGSAAPPFHPLTPVEERELERLFMRAEPDVIWVGMSTPKQEVFMARLSRALPSVVMVGVGAAFDLHAGRRRDAPEWIKRYGLQWLYRLGQEPGRLWRRYLRIVPAFIVLMGLSATGLRSFPLDADPPDGL